MVFGHSGEELVWQSKEICLTLRSRGTAENRALPWRGRRLKLGSMTDGIKEQWCGVAAGWRRYLTGWNPRVADIRKLEQAWPKLATISGDEW